ncbi:MAG: hypothetical protein L0312_25670 [Acidobacteria bacterium]|nr:hypothetical protein [Acidobacteriota bacterium]
MLPTWKVAFVILTFLSLVAVAALILTSLLPERISWTLAAFLGALCLYWVVEGVAVKFESKLDTLRGEIRQVRGRLEAMHVTLQVIDQSLRRAVRLQRASLDDNEEAKRRALQFDDEVFENVREFEDAEEQW